MTEERTQMKIDYCLTQQYIWEILGQSTATFRDSSIQNQYVAFKAEIEQKIANMEKTPSFTKETITVDAGTTTTLIDKNGVLKDYASVDRAVNGIRITHNYGENTMNVTVDENCNLESYIFTVDELQNWGLIKEESRNHDTTVYITFKSRSAKSIICFKL